MQCEKCGKPNMQGQKKFIKAFDTLVDTIQNDKGLYLAYQSTIAETFVDELINNGIQFPNMHKMANNAARAFLTILINKREEHVVKKGR